MGFTTIQRSDEGVEALPYQFYGHGGDDPSTFTSPGVRIRRPTAGVVLLLEVGGYAGSEFDTTVGVVVQTRFAGRWFDIALFPAIVAADASTYNDAFLLKLSATEPNAGLSEAQPGMVAGNVAHFIGEEWRVKYTITGSEADSGAYFGVHIIPIG